MIKNDKQYQVTKKRYKEFSDALIETQNQKENDSYLQLIQEQALKGKIQDLQNELEEYEQLKAGNINHVVINSPVDLAEVLIKSRISLGLSQADLASRLNIQEQQIQRYEACNYSTASFPRIQEVVNALGVQFPQMIVQLPNSQLNLSEDVSNTLFAIKSKLNRNKQIFVVE